MKKVFVFLMTVLAAIVSVAMGGWDGYAPVATAKVTYQVVDQDGKLIEGGAVSQCFFNRRDPGPGELLTGITDTNGLVSFEGLTSGEISYRAQMDGYYDISGGYKKWMEVWRPPSSNIKNGRWEPWNPRIEVRLKEIKNPIPMYVKGVNLGVPEFDKPLGFDLEKGDWVAPHGKGVVSDFIFYATLDKRSSKESDYRLILTFPNEKEGIQATGSRHPMYGNKLASDHLAPEEGYLSKWEQFRNRRPKTMETNRDINRIYCFRVRTVLDEQGNIISALYGKIYGDFLHFTYYLNPTPNDRNIECDPGENLFGGRTSFAP